MLKSDWKSTPGGYDKLHIGKLFESNNEYGIPELLPIDEVPTELIPYGTEVRRSYACVREKTVHFFLDDYRFESLWERPIKTLNPIKNIGFALTPDFSLYTDYPIALQIYNVYRNRWLGRYWQSEGVKVIPTVAWSDSNSYPFCFKGIPKNSIVAVSTVGVCNSQESIDLFMQGFEEMIRQLEPKKVLIYGKVLEEMSKFDSIEFITYPTYWEVKKRGRVEE